MNILEGGIKIKKKNEALKEVNLRATEQTKAEMDGTNYYDQNDDQWGQSIDESTGKSYESTNRGIDDDAGHVFEKSDSSDTQILAELENDPASKYLKEQGFDEYGNKAA